MGAAHERALGIASHWPFEQWGRFLPEHVTATSRLDRLLHHATVVVTEGGPSACWRPVPAPAGRP
ncbi:ATP-binding protein [Catellatospora sichuanensis]|uniref:ATP-binding protein n=1 Tax=Catellatospora sichuanensis TaxID=1969805 RepID=UPI003CCC7ADD